jgi:predicted Zn-dependent protease
MIEEASSAEELAGVLAHEVQHIEHRHTLQQMIHTAGWAAVLAVALGDVSAITAIVIHQLGNLRNSRELENQADTEGMKALAKAGIPLDGMATMFRKLQKQQERRGGEGIALLSSHPATEERIARLEQLARTLACDCRPLAVDWPAVQAATKAWRAEQ